MICANRDDTPAFFTPCVTVCGGKCPCAEDLRAEEKAAKVAQACATGARSAEQAENAPNDTREISGAQNGAQRFGRTA